MNHPVFCRKCFTNIFQRKLINDLDVFSTVLWYLFPLLSSLFAQSSCDLGKCFGIQYTSLNVSKWKTNNTFFLDGRFIAFEVKYLLTLSYIQPRWFKFFKPNCSEQWRFFQSPLYTDYMRYTSTLCNKLTNKIYCKMKSYFFLSQNKESLFNLALRCAKLIHRGAD